MPKIRYQTIKFNDTQLSVIRNAEKILQEYADGGYVPTLRSLYYQFVARDIFPDSWIDPATGSKNNEKSYDKLGVIISNARLAGLIDWTALEDITREIVKNPHWTGPQDIISACAGQFRLDLWENQDKRVEVWVEKDALKGIIAPPCRELDIPYFSCRGYTSMTAMWDAAQRLLGYVKAGQSPVILHFGDHDPSGIDMSRDIEERIQMFMQRHGADLGFERIALNMDQINQYNPPENPAKVTDSRAKKYMEEYGDSSWELDALTPQVMDQLIRDNVEKHLDRDLFEAQETAQQEHRDNLQVIANHYDAAIKAAKKAAK